MFNNFQNLFEKYAQKINLQKDLEIKVQSLLRDVSGLEISLSQIKIDQKEKSIKIVNLPSSKKFFLNQKAKILFFEVLENDNKSKVSLTEKVKKEFGFSLVV